MPTLIFVVVYLFTMKESVVITLEIRYRLAMIFGWIFLIYPFFITLIMTVNISSVGRIHAHLFTSACCVGSFGLALTAVRLRVSNPTAAFILLIVSGLSLGVILYGWFSKAYIV